MSSRAAVFERVQFAVEATPGTALAATKQFFAIEMDADPIIPVTNVQPMGTKYAVDVVIGKEHTEASLQGQAAFDDLLYLMSTILCLPTSAVPSGATLTNRFTFAPSSTDPDTRNTLTIEKGSAAGGGQFAYGFLDELELDITPEKTVDLKGKMMGRAYADGFTMTTGTTRLSPHVISPKQVDFYVATSEAGLSGGHIKPLNVNWKLSKRFTEVYTVDSSNPSFDTAVETSPDLITSITVEQNTAAAAYMTALRGAALYYGQIVATGALIETAGAIANPVAAPTDGAATTGGTIPAGTYFTAYTFLNVSGETQVSPTTTQATTGTTSTLTITGAILPSGATGVNVYVGTSAGNLKLAGTSATNAVTVTALPSGGAATPPAANTTGLAFPYRLAITFPFKFSNPKRVKTQDLYTGTYDLVAVHDPAFNSGAGGALKVQIDTALTTL